MEFRKTVESDINDIMVIIKKAQNFLREKGIPQWQNGYPGIQIIKNDLKKGYAYVLIDVNKVIATLAISFDGEKTYKDIYDGKWISNDQYAVIHRLAIDDDYKGKEIASIIINNIEKICLDKGIDSIKIDTHRKNLPMQRMLKKNGFKYCGVIYLEDKSERLAFEKIL
ncbi:GNAT family N-acetyltransferase [Clostridium sp. D2Q-14]|uniref:GNAT family N-acetyltransferase n=1 Tax=Anaeromonas gelatinilytica TaxID=2683194 RepID=UPI00193C828E|nr:GNAT family N-acetyltransferase [Anaeromonas gelatinilytica]MBS4536303.1 GNAT family N-acetyltransferase [Anaeromonas gelatinilytica]